MIGLFFLLEFYKKKMIFFSTAAFKYFQNIKHTSAQSGHCNWAVDFEVIPESKDGFQTSRIWEFLFERKRIHIQTIVFRYAIIETYSRLFFCNDIHNLFFIGVFY